MALFEDMELEMIVVQTEFGGVAIHCAAVVVARSEIVSVAGDDNRCWRKRSRRGRFRRNPRATRPLRQRGRRCNPDCATRIRTSSRSLIVMGRGYQLLRLFVFDCGGRDRRN